MKTGLVSIEQKIKITNKRIFFKKQKEKTYKEAETLMCKANGWCSIILWR
jgi:hypothetical protein